MLTGVGRVSLTAANDNDCHRHIFLLAQNFCSQAAGSSIYFIDVDSRK